MDQKIEQPAQQPGAGRRRFFKRAAITTLIASLAAGVGFKVFAQGGHGGWHRGGFMSGPLDPAEMEKRLERMLRYVYAEVDATDAQKEKLSPIVKAAAKDLLPLRGRMAEARRKGLELLTAERVDRVALEVLRAEQLQAAEAATRRLSIALADIADVLTPEQRKDLAARFDKRHQRRWG